MPNDEFVTKSDCAKTMDPLTKNVETVLKALVGDDLRGGIVKDVADIKAALKAKPAPIMGSKVSWSRREYGLVAATIISASSSVIIAFIETFH